MSTDLEVAERDVISQRAAQWLTRLSEGHPADRPAFVRWLKKSPRHVEEFLLMSAVCKGLRSAGPGDMAGIEQLIAKATSESNVLTLARPDDMPQQSAHASTRQVTRWAAIAASIAAVLLGAIWAAPWINAQLNTYMTDVGEQRTVRLADGSVVYMNARSRFRVSYSDTERDIELQNGEAMFKVERVPSRPFRVYSRETTIQAIGTQFNVYRRAEGDTVISVIDGAVRVSKGSSNLDISQPSKATALQLDAGEEAQVRVTGQIIKRNSADLSRATAWRERRLVFRESRLEDIAAEFARYSPRRIVLEDEASRAQRITGTFDADDPASLVQFLGKLEGFTVEASPDWFIVRSAEPR